MFVELMPLLAGRTVLITVAKVDDKTLRVNVIPTQAKADENPALTTPLTYTGRPEELDAELGKHLAGYVQTHTQTASTLAEDKATMEAAAKAAQEEAKRKAESERRRLRSHLTREPLHWRLSLLQPLLPHPQLLLSPRHLQHLRGHLGCSHLQLLNPLQLNRKEVAHSDGDSPTFSRLRIQRCEAPGP